MKKKNHYKLFILILGVLIFVPFILSAQANKELIQEGELAIINRTGITSGDNTPVGFGLKELFQAVSANNATIKTVKYWTQTDHNAFLVVGTPKNSMVARLLDQSRAPLSKREGVIYQWVETRAGTALVVAGTDERGLMYALLELSDRVKAHGLQALNAVEDQVEFPDNQVRGVDRFVQNPNIHPWVLSKDFWESYVKRLAHDRFNRLVVITGYNTGYKAEYMRPPYPFIVDVPTFPDVQLSSKFDRQTIRENLRTIGRLCHTHGLDFEFGTWYNGKENLAGEETKSVTGLPEAPKRYSLYVKKGMAKLLKAVPEIDGVQLRINFEAGLGHSGQTAEQFWKGIIESVGKASRVSNKDLFLDIRAKGLTKRMRDWVLEEGLNLSVPTKYTWEELGLPYHTTRMRVGELNNLDNLDRRQRYSYADFLYKPRSFDIIYRMWSYGTHRLFIWGDPDYARRFSQSAGFGGGTGFEVTPPLSMKKGNWKLFKDQSLKHYKWQDERYWAWYLFFGRLGYNTDADPAIWEREFRKHFGKAGPDMLRAYQTAGKFLPLLTSAHLTKHPGFSHWAEKNTGGALFPANNVNPDIGRTTYITVEPGDPGLFYGIDDYVEDYVGDSLHAKYTPQQLSQRYMNIARQTQEDLSTLKEEKVPSGQSGEFEANLRDLKATADLAAFHSYKTRAALNLCFYQKTGKVTYLPPALKNMKAAQKKWQSLVNVTTKTYNNIDKPFFVRYNSGKNWPGMLKVVNADVEELKKMIQKENFPKGNSSLNGRSKSIISNLFFPLVSIRDDVPKTWVAGKDLAVKILLNLSTELDIKKFILYYRQANQIEGKFNRVEMQKTQTGFKGVIPGEYITPDYDLLVYCGGINKTGNAAIIYPGLYNPEYSAPYHVIEIKEKE